MARKKKIHHRHNRLSFGGKLAFVLLTILSAVILIPIVFTFLYSFFPQSEITAYLKGRGSYDTTKWLDVLYSPAMFSLRQYYKIFIEEPSYLKLFCNSMMYTGAILVGQALIVPLTAYCLSRFQFHGRDLLFFCILVLMILPLSWVFKAGEEVYGERYWLIFMGAVGDGDFWLFDWRIAQEMCELKCVVRCRRNVMG